MKRIRCEVDTTDGMTFKAGVVYDLTLVPRPRPRRIQRSRAKGWRMPPNTVYVGRPTLWGNQFRTDDALGVTLGWDHETVVSLHRLWITSPWMERSLPYLLAQLRGRDLACWCPLDQPCHADVLLELANE